MSEWAVKRFWSQTHVVPAEDGFTVTLDARPLWTPAKTPLILPTRALADLIAAEWQDQTGKVDPRLMPMTRMANSAIDKVGSQHAEVAALLAAYGETDLLCHRATAPEALIICQAAAWDPVLDWAAQTLGVRLKVVAGVMPAVQDSVGLARLHGRINAMDAFGLTGFHDLVSLSGSLILGFGAAFGAYTAEVAWSLSRIDEDWQLEVWGHDDEAVAAGRLKSAAFMDAARFYLLSQQAPGA